MAKGFIWDDQSDDPKDWQWVPRNMFRRYTGPRTPNLIKDDLGVKGVYNPGTGRRYDSRSQYHSDLKAKGLHVVERGESMDGEAQRKAADAALDQKNIGRDMKTAIEQLRVGYRG